MAFFIQSLCYKQQKSGAEPLPSVIDLISVRCVPELRLRKSAVYPWFHRWRSVPCDKRLPLPSPHRSQALPSKTAWTRHAGCKPFPRIAGRPRLNGSYRKLRLIDTGLADMKHGGDIAHSDARVALFQNQYAFQIIFWWFINAFHNDPVLAFWC